MWCWMRLQIVSWTEKRSNVSISETGRSRRELLAVTVKQQMTFFGNVMRADCLENLAVPGSISGSRSRGRPWKKYMDTITEMYGRGGTPQQLLNMTKDRGEWRFINGNVFNGSVLR